MTLLRVPEFLYMLKAPQVFHVSFYSVYLVKHLAKIINPNLGHLKVLEHKKKKKVKA